MFTDEDLKRLELGSRYFEGGEDNAYRIMIVGIIARLKAAEAYGHYGSLLHGGKSAECVLDRCDMCKSKAAWLKSKGTDVPR